jgi:type IV pilus assembly protein PilY1
MVYDVGSDQVDDLVYAGDLAGNLWRFDLSDNNPNSWKVDLMFTTYGDGGATNVGDQPIVFNPTAMNDPVTRRTVIVVGTGKYLGRDDRTSAIPQQAFYGIRDYAGSTAYPVRVNQLITQTLTQGTTTSTGLAARSISGWTAPSGTLPTGTPNMILGSVNASGQPVRVSQVANGWRMPLTLSGNPEPGERAERRAVPDFTSNVAVLYTMIPKGDDPCDPGRRFAIMAINGANGAATFPGAAGTAPGVGKVGAVTGSTKPPGDPVQKRGGAGLIIPGLPDDVQTAIGEAFTPPPWHRGAWKELLDLQ